MKFLRKLLGALGRREDIRMGIEPIETEIDETKIKGVVSDNLLGTRSSEYRNYLSINTECLRIALSLRQKTLGKSDEITAQTMKDNPIGYYFARVESNLRKLANSLAEIGAVLTLLDVGASDIEDVMSAALQRASLLFGVPTESGTNTTGLAPEERISAYSATHKKAFDKLVGLYRAGCKMEMPPSLRGDFGKMLTSLRRELETGTRLFG
jgi:hypothetical protein